MKSWHITFWMGMIFPIFLCTPGMADVIFSQDFSSSSTLSDYINASADASNTTQFSEISTLTGSTYAGGPWSISGGALVLDRTAASGFARSNVLRRQNLDGSPLISVSFSLSINKDGNYAYDGTGFLDGQSNIPYGGYTNRLSGFALKAGATSQTYVVNGYASNEFNLNEAYTYRIYSNFSGATETYTGPDSLSHSIDHNRLSLWIGNTLVVDNIANTYSFAGTNIVSFAMDWNKPDGATWIFDDFVVRNDLNVVPEPASMALLVTGGAVLLIRRKRRRG